MSDPYREPGPTDTDSPWPRWPAMRALAILAGFVFSRRGAAMVWLCVRVGVAFILMPLTMALHGLRSLGGADPERRDAAAIVFKAWNIDDLRYQPFALIGALLACALWMLSIISAIISVTT